MIVNFTVGTSWTPIVAPFDCNYYGILATSGSWPMRCSDPTDDSTSYQMGNPFVMNSPRSSISPCRFGSGKPVTWLKAASGQVQIAVEFVEEWRLKV